MMEMKLSVPSSNREQGFILNTVTGSVAIATTTLPPPQYT